MPTTRLTHVENYWTDVFFESQISDLHQSELNSCLLHMIDDGSGKRVTVRSEKDGILGD